MPADVHAFEGIEGQHTAIGVLTRALAANRLASAYLFEGPSGVGKQLAAIALAKAAIGEAAWRRIGLGVHPDVRVFEPREDGARNIRVERLREDILPHAEFAPFEAPHSFLIFPECDVSFPQQHQQSANTLLKTLEEPKRGVTFLLLSERPDRLLPTIRSRCQQLRFNRLEPDVIERILVAHEVPPERRGAAAALADGRADRALLLAEEGYADALLDLALRVDEALGRNRPGTLIELASELAKHDDTPLALDTLCLFYRDVAAAALGRPSESLAFRHVADLVFERAAKVGARIASERVAAVQRVLREDLPHNANPAIAMDGLLYQMQSL